MTNEIVDLDARKKWHIEALRRSARRAIQTWNAIAERKYAPFLIIAVWILVSVPPALYHGYHYVEGLTVTVAQSALDDGDWLTPHLYNLRWIERPTLLSWIIAAISTPAGHVSPFVARLPIILSLLVGTFLIWSTLRRVASSGAAMLGALAFLASPIVIRYYVTAVADLPLAVVLFSAFLIWWDAYTSGRISLGRWIGIGCMLAIAALLKGPQPVAYFGLGLITFIALTSTWWQIPGLFLAGVLAAVPTGLWYAYVFVPGDQGEWLRYTRLSPAGFAEPHPILNGIDFFFNAIPATLFAVPLLLTRGNAVGKTVPRHFLLALSCYALACTFLILFWPAEINPRYTLPMILPLCVLAGVAYDALQERRPALIAGGISITLGLLGYATIHSVSNVLLEPAYNHSKIDGSRITELVARAPAPVYRVGWDTGLNELAYFARRTTAVEQNAIPTIAKPAWIVVPADAANTIVAQGNGRITSRLVMDRAVLLRLE